LSDRWHKPRRQTIKTLWCPLGAGIRTWSSWTWGPSRSADSLYCGQPGEHHRASPAVDPALVDQGQARRKFGGGRLRLTDSRSMTSWCRPAPPTSSSTAPGRACRELSLVAVSCSGYDQSIMVDRAGTLCSRKIGSADDRVLPFRRETTLRPYPPPPGAAVAKDWPSESRDPSSFPPPVSSSPCWRVFEQKKIMSPTLDLPGWAAAYALTPLEPRRGRQLWISRVPKPSPAEASLAVRRGRSGISRNVRRAHVRRRRSRGDLGIKRRGWPPRCRWPRTNPFGPLLGCS